MLVRHRLIPMFVAAALGIAAAEVRAGPVPVTFNTSGGNGSASVTFTSMAGGILITLSNNQTGANNYSDGAAVSGLSFAWNGLGAISSLTKLVSEQVVFSTSGKGVNSTQTFSITPYTNTGPFPGNSSPGTIGGSSHWGFQGSSVGAVILETVDFTNTGLTGAKPFDLIIPTESTANPYTVNSSVLQHGPSLNGSANFFVADSSITAKTQLYGSDFSNLVINFGTGTATQKGTQTSGPVSPSPLSNVPAPPSIVLMGVGAACALAFAARSSRKRIARTA